MTLYGKTPKMYHVTNNNVLRGKPQPELLPDL